MPDPALSGTETFHVFHAHRLIPILVRKLTESTLYEPGGDDEVRPLNTYVSAIFDSQEKSLLRTFLDIRWALPGDDEGEL